MKNGRKKSKSLKFYLIAPVFLLVGAGVSAFGGLFSFEEKRSLSFEGKKRVVLEDAGMSYRVFTEADTVKEFIKRENLKIREDESVSPGLETRIYPGAKITINRKYSIEVKADGEKKTARLEKMKVKQALREMGVKLSELDEVKPEKKAIIKEGLEVEITRVKEKEITESFDIDFKTVTKKDDDLKWGKTKIEQKGEKGEKEIDYLVRYENGELVSKERLSQRIIKKPVSKIIVKGTKIEIGDIQRGVASWYDHTKDMTCASVKFPRGTWLRVRNQENKKEIIVQVDDYGPSPETGKIIDLEKEAFKKIADPWKGVVEVKVEEIL
jgi:uncharacterized protein YabE (DUF348 family)